MKPWNERVVVITGASGGLGLEMARQVAEYGGMPVMLARSYGRLLRAASEIKEQSGIAPYVYELDVSNEAAVKETFHSIYASVGAVDVLINNAGFGKFDLFENARMSDIKEMFEVNVYGLVACTQAVLPYMKEARSGHIIHIASQAGKISTPKSSGYAATKHAVLAFANSLRMELEGTGIRISAVNPGPVKTDFFSRADETGEYEKNVEKYMLDAKTVAGKTLKLIDKPKRELNLPRWMDVGTRVYQVFPALMEKAAASQFRKK
ncbi:SDR family NAD(P)-dependent oxidoreductase [Alteribacter keqinensis]|uniref:SDR family oxidoreductase n=1 Tax=Alteribacter keqinensis TaxID=2483800 RepID=A0A3M7TUX5_9BACI|nr:SDR family oxidoreductase [Alteribacter keqinensis]RNA69029.1 SDR family oxidoreductase [Alteribacter keqinensis]